ncbi:hypothetical protein EVAR_11722_1 [Eumeta japonica]|uniref:Uncharacterized protein n=1 Tax=Eumeta variegata TaxID=151549 RepID=A0A4C1U660_EUMVA|nr:hypothetical protein EVAR_11722_1 [Eumeta japonica]
MLPGVINLITVASQHAGVGERGVCAHMPTKPSSSLSTKPQPFRDPNLNPLRYEKRRNSTEFNDIVPLEYFKKRNLFATETFLCTPTYTRREHIH